MQENTEKKIISEEGLKKYQEELDYLKVHRREEIAIKIREAREQGDLSENAEYDAAREEQSELEARIKELENIISNAQTVSKDEIKKGVINIGSHITLYDEVYDEEIEYDLVGATEADSLNGKISNESPLGKALIGKKKNDEIEIPIAQKEKAKYKILKVN